ncbi:MAG: Uma2 family endonuclease [Cyanobacteria bacterium P01_G01_bin.38]
MTSQLLKKPISFTRYLLLPYDRKRTELVDGQIIEMSDPSILHTDIVHFLSMAIQAYIAAQSLDLTWRTGVSLEIPHGDTSNARRPDLIICDRTQWKGMRHLTKSIFPAGEPPALAIEVVSPDNPNRDTVDKRQEYALAGVPEYWIVNPLDGYVLVLVLKGSDYQEVGEFRGDEPISSELFPNLEITAGEMLDP